MVSFQGFKAPRDRRTDAQREADQAPADKQAARAAGWSGVDEQRIIERARRVINDRRARRLDNPNSPLKPLELLRRGGRWALVVTDERLVRTDRLSQNEVQALIEGGAKWVAHLEGRLLVVTGTRRRGDSAHHAVPFGPVMKAAVGAEPATPPSAAAGATTASASSVPVAVIDTGVAGSTRDDGWLAAVNETDDNRDPLDVLPPDNRLDLGAGHGTFVAGIIEQVEPRAETRMYRALDSDGVGTEASVASAMVQAAKEGAKVICLSLGLQTVDDVPPVGLQVAVEVIREEWPDVLIVAAAGNFGDTRPCWPAALKGVTAVAGLDRELQRAPWSSHGPWVNCSTIGEAVRSTFVPGTERDDVDPDPQPDHYPPNAWAIWSGTSFAAPQVAAAVGQLVISNGVSAADALAILLNGVPDTPDVGCAVRILPPT